MSPSRTETNRRLYTEDDIERLKLLKRVIQEGYSIGQVAGMPSEALVSLAEGAGKGGEQDSRPMVDEPVLHLSPGGQAAKRYLSDCLAAVDDLDDRKLEDVLRRASIAFSRSELVEFVISPLQREIGVRWRRGSLRIAQEHLATAVLRTFLGSLIAACSVPDSAPELIVATPSGQIHELGALAVAAAAQDEGWRVTYLGPSLPAEEIAAAAVRHGARAVAVSIVHPSDDPRLDGELRRLRAYLPPEVSLFAGGQAASALAAALAEVGALMIDSIPAFRASLEALRSRSLERAD